MIISIIKDGVTAIYDIDLDRGGIMSQGVTGSGPGGSALLYTYFPGSADYKQKISEAIQAVGYTVYSHPASAQRMEALLGALKKLRG